jgi:hypothetical protein
MTIYCVKVTRAFHGGGYVLDKAVAVALHLVIMNLSSI